MRRMRYRLKYGNIDALSWESIGRNECWTDLVTNTLSNDVFVEGMWVSKAEIVSLVLCECVAKSLKAANRAGTK